MKFKPIKENIYFQREPNKEIKNILYKKHPDQEEIIHDIKSNWDALKLFGFDDFFTIVCLKKTNLLPKHLLSNENDLSFIVKSCRNIFNENFIQIEKKILK